MMTDREMKQLLSRVKDAPELGGDADGKRAKNAWLRICDELGWDAQDIAGRPAYGWKDYADYYLHTFAHNVMRPMAVAASVFVIILSGWITTVDASFNSIPGDVLYPVKLATERVQLTLATSTHKRASLHVEFAGRRVQEISQLREDAGTSEQGRVEEAAQDFRQELQQAQAQLAKLRESNPEHAVQVAVELDQKSGEYERALGQMTTQASEPVKDAVDEARSTARATGNEAIRALVEETGVSDNVPLRENLQQSFQNKFQVLKDRITLSLGRMAVIDAALDASATEHPDLASALYQARSTTLAQEANFAEAMNMFVAGGYQKAFDALESVNASLAQVEESLTELEIALTTKDLSPLAQDDT